MLSRSGGGTICGKEGRTLLYLSSRGRDRLTSVCQHARAKPIGAAVLTPARADYQMMPSLVF